MRRFRYFHINKLRRQEGKRPFRNDSREKDLVKAILNASIKTGHDETGITNYIESWYKLGQNAGGANESEWPSILLTDTKFFFNNLPQVLEYLGVPDNNSTNS